MLPEIDAYQAVDGFAVRLVDQGYYGMQPRFFDAAGRDLGGFTWGNWMDVRMRSWTAADIPIGTTGKSFSDGEEGWWLHIRPHEGFVLVLEGDETRDKVEILVKVPRDEYFAAWLDAIREARETCSTFMSLAEAERAPGPVTRLLIGSYSHDSTLADVDRVLRFPNLTQLALRRLGLDTLPEEIGTLSRLKYLDVHDSRLASLPDSMGQLENLELLNVMGNRLRDLPDALFDLPRLRALNLIANDFTTAPVGLRRMRALRGVRFDGNPLPESELDRLHSWFDHVDGFDTYFG
jgi:Leucine Rich Repeat (LRR) protein